MMRRKLLRTFRNSYLAVLLIFAFDASAQNLTPVPGTGQIHEAIQVQKALMLPGDTVKSTAKNADTCRQVAFKNGDLYRYNCSLGHWVKIVSGASLDSARRSNDTLYFRTSSGDEIAIKMEGIKIPGVNGLQDSLTARYTKAQADAKFIQGNQTITLSGDVTGSGTTAITTALKNTGTAGTYTKVTTDPEGRVSSGTTLSAGDIPDLSSTYIPLTQKGAASGVATLGMDGKVPSSQLPTTGSLYQGTWNASTNTPTIADGSGTAGQYYRVNVAGTQDLGSGNIAFSVGDDVIYNGSVWQRIPGGSAVNSVNGYTGDVVLTKGDVGLGNVDNTTDLAKPVSTATQTALNLKANSAITLAAGTGLTGGGNLTANRSFAVNFGTAAGTVAQGNDSRINNGQTAFGWGNHASAGYLTTTTGDARYPQLSGSYANPSWLTSLAWSKITGAPTFWQSSNHPAGTTGSITYTGAEVPASFSFNSAGHYTASGKRTLTAGDVGAAPASGSGYYIRSGTTPSSIQSGGTFFISGAGRSNGNFDVWREGSDLFSGGFALYNSSGTKGAVMQLNGDANPGLATRIFDGTTWAKRFEIFSNGRAQFYSNVSISNPAATLSVEGKVGIGVSSPASKLEVNGTITAPVLQSPSGENLVLLANSAPTGAQVTLTTDGLGIGGVPGGTHTARLFVAGNAVANDAWILDNSAGLMGEFFIDGSSGMGIRTVSNHPLSFYANDQKRIEVRANGVIHTTAGVSSHARLVSTASAFTIQPQDYVVIMEGMGTAAGDGVLITLPDPSTNGGRLLEFHEYSASSWAVNYDIYQPLLSPLTTISGVMVIRAVNGKWRLVSKN